MLNTPFNYNDNNVTLTRILRNFNQVFINRKKKLKKRKKRATLVYDKGVGSRNMLCLEEDNKLWQGKDDIVYVIFLAKAISQHESSTTKALKSSQRVKRVIVENKKKASFVFLSEVQQIKVH